MGLDLDVSTPEGAFGIASLVLLLALIAVRLSRRLGMPSLLLYLGIGMVLGIDIAARLCDDLLAQGAPGLHFYTLNRSKATMQIYESLSVGIG